MITHIQNVDNGVQNDNDDFRVFGFQQIAQWLENVERHEVADLRYATTGRQIRDHPDRFLLTLEISLSTHNVIKCKTLTNAFEIQSTSTHRLKTRLI